MNILLTGANGNLGQEFIRQTKHRVIQLNRPDWNDLDENLKSSDIVIHAACDLHTSIREFPHKLLESNIITTTKLLEGIKKHKVQRLIFISTCAVYGSSLSTQEDTACNPTSINGITKLLNERMIEEFCVENNIEFQILRIFNTYGGKDNFSILSHIKKSLERNTPFNLNNNGIAQRDFIHITDVVSIIKKLIEEPTKFNHLNIGTGRSTRISYIIDILKLRYPNMIINNTQIEEVEYSRANIDKLSTQVQHEFISIEDYLNDTFIPSINI